MVDTLTTLNADRHFSACRTDQGTVLLVNGLDRPVIWDGVQAVRDAGLSILTAYSSWESTGIAASGSGSLSGDYTAYFRFVDNDTGYYSDLSPISNSITASSDAQIDYANLPSSDPDSRADQIQVFRNTDGQTDVYYLDATITIGTTTGSSTKTDAQLRASTRLPLVNPDSTHNANRHGLAPDFMSCVFQLKDRVFACVPAEYTAGHVEVTGSSSTVQGRGTNFTSEMAGRKMAVVGDSSNSVYTIQSVNTSTQAITLTGNYGGSTALFEKYRIYPDPDELDRIYFSENSLPESWPKDQNYLILQQDVQHPGRQTGGFSHGPYGYILRENHIYRLSYVRHPALDGEVYLVASRGCANNRCWVYAEDVVYILDTKGIYAFNGEETQPISLPIQDLWRDGRINWGSRENFFGVHDPQSETVKFAVSIGSSPHPNQFLVYQYRLNRWWIEEYPTAIGSGCVAHLGGDSRLVLGSEYFDCLTTDQLLDRSTTRRTPGTVTSATTHSLTDSAASFTGLATGTPVTIVEGTGLHQTRIIAEVDSATEISFNTPWLIVPDTTSKYQIGGVPYAGRFGRFLYTAANERVKHRAEIFFQPTDAATKLYLRRFDNFDALTPLVPIDSYPTGALGATTGGVADHLIDMTKSQTLGNSTGHSWWQWQSHINDQVASDRGFALELRGTQGPDPVVINRIELTGTGR